MSISKMMLLSAFAVLPVQAMFKKWFGGGRHESSASQAPLSEMPTIEYIQFFPRIQFTPSFIKDYTKFKGKPSYLESMIVKAQADGNIGGSDLRRNFIETWTPLRSERRVIQTTYEIPAGDVPTAINFVQSISDTWTWLNSQSSVKPTITRMMHHKHHTSKTVRVGAVYNAHPDSQSWVYEIYSGGDNQSLQFSPSDWNEIKGQSSPGSAMHRVPELSTIHESSVSELTTVMERLGELLNILANDRDWQIFAQLTASERVYKFTGDYRTTKGSAVSGPWTGKMTVREGWIGCARTV